MEMSTQVNHPWMLFIHLYNFVISILLLETICQYYDLWFNPLNILVNLIILSYYYINHLFINYLTTISIDGLFVSSLLLKSFTNYKIFFGTFLAGNYSFFIAFWTISCISKQSQGISLAKISHNKVPYANKSTLLS